MSAPSLVPGLALAVGLALPDVVGLGAGPLLVILGTVAVTFALALGLGRVLRVAPTVTVLAGTGTAICGASAVAGMAPPEGIPLSSF